MRKINKSAIVPFSAEQMFNVVNDVAAYPEFLPWCVGAEIQSQDEQSMVAKVEIAQSGLEHSFTTRNQLNFPESIVMELVDGPFSELSGSWKFDQLGNDGCKVTMDLVFDFNSKLFNLTLASVFNTAADKMVDSFCDRAESVYG